MRVWEEEEALQGRGLAIGKAEVEERAGPT
jgi:hypothetical protein